MTRYHYFCQLPKIVSSEMNELHLRVLQHEYGQVNTNNCKDKGHGDKSNNIISRKCASRLMNLMI